MKMWMFAYNYDTVEFEDDEEAEKQLEDGFRTFERCARPQHNVSAT